MSDNGRQEGKTGPAHYHLGEAMPFLREGGWDCLMKENFPLNLQQEKFQTLEVQTFLYSFFFLLYPAGVDLDHAEGDGPEWTSRSAFPTAPYLG